jgi:FtsZ-interacting cell division protein YlmF
VEANEFTMQYQEEGNDSIVEDTTNNIVEDVEEGITNHEEPIFILRKSQREKKAFDRLITSVIAIEVTIDENLLLKPTSFEEAMSTLNKVKWEEAINFEFHSLMQNETWTLTDLPLRQKTVGCKWILKIKLKSDGIIDRYKT